MAFASCLFSTQQIFTCSKLTIETAEKGVKYVQSQQKRDQCENSDVVLVSVLTILNIVHAFF